MLVADGRQPQHAERGVLGRLEHQRVAGAERGRDLERGEDDRRIPGDDGAHHADRLAPRVAENVLAERDGLALQLAGEAAEVADDVGGAPGLGPRLGAQRVAGLLGDDAGQLLDPRLHRVGDLLQQAASLARHHAAPGRERSARQPSPPGRCPPPRRAGRCRWCADCRGFRPGCSLPETDSTQLPSISICARFGPVPACALLIATAITLAPDRNRPPLDRDRSSPLGA